MAVDSVVSDDSLPKPEDPTPPVPTPPGSDKTKPTTTKEVSFATISTGPSGGKRASRKNVQIDEDEEPLVDLTASLPLHSKKTTRLQKRLEGKSKKSSKPTRHPQTLLDLPTELLQEILAHLRPSDIFCLTRVSKPTQNFIAQHESSLARDIITTRYAHLAASLPLPVPFSAVDRTAHSALLSPKRQEMLAIHRKPYQHVQGIDPLRTCTCMACVFAWNNLCMCVDLAHWQKNLDGREPIPMISRGKAPEWNRELLARNAGLVEKAMDAPLWYVSVLEHHLASTTKTILRRSKYVKAKPVLPEHRPYSLSLAEAGMETDEYLGRRGPPSYEFPFHRDNYYNLEAYVPNRKWSEEEERWMYYHGKQHDRDLEWVKARFGPEEDGEKVVKRVEELSRRLGRGVISW